jgi:excisionase family DNA binding protein
MKDQIFYTPKDVASILLCSVKTVYSLGQSKKIPGYIKFKSGMVRINKEIFDKWINYISSNKS